MAGRVQIEALGQLSDSLTVDPSFSFFTKRYSRYTNYANENYKIDFADGVYTNDFLDVPIPQKYGDILQDVTLSFSVDPANVGSNISPIDVFGISVIEYVELYVGEQNIDTVTSDDIFIDRELNVPESYRSSLDILHGKHFQGSSDREFLQEFYDGQYNTQGIDPFGANEYRVHIPFYFHRRPGHGFPLCTLRDQELSLRIKLRPAVDVLFATRELFGDNLWDPRANDKVIEQLKLDNFKVNLNLIHIDNVERYALQSKPMNILFEQRQRNIFQIEPQSKVGVFKLDFKNCVKELFFISKKIGRWNQEHISILDQLRQLDQYSDAQNNLLIALKQIDVWPGAIKIALDELSYIEDTEERNATIDFIRQSIFWGGNEGEFENLKESDPLDQSIIDNLKLYIDGIPTEIFTIQENAFTILDQLPNETTVLARTNIINSLPNVWEPEQLGILELLKNPGLPQEDALIFALRAHLATLSYNLRGLDDLRPGTTEQIALTDKLKEFLDDTKIRTDIVKVGLKGVLNEIPGKTSYLRTRIINGLIRVGGQIWRSDQITALKTLLVVPGNDEDDILEQDNTINILTSYLDTVYTGADYTTKAIIEGVLNELDDVSGTTDPARTDRIDALLGFDDVWQDEILTLVNSLTNLLPGNPLRETVINTLISYTKQILGIIPTFKFFLNYLKGGVFQILDSLPSSSSDRFPIILGLLGLQNWNEEQRNLIIALRNQTSDDQMYIFALKNSIAGDNLYTILSSLPVTQEDREPIINNVINLRGWSDPEKNILYALYTPTEYAETYINTLFSTISQFDQNLYLERLTPVNIWGEDFFTINDLRLVTPGFIGETAAINAMTPTGADYLLDGIDDTLDNLPQADRDSIIEGLRALGIWNESSLTNLNSLLTQTPDDQSYITQLKGYIDGSILNFQDVISTLGNAIVNDTYQELTTNQVQSLQALGEPFWGELYPSLSLLSTSGGTVSLVQTLIQYVTGVLFNYQLLERGITETISTTLPNETNVTNRTILCELLLRYDVWSPIQKNLLLGELRVPDSQNHAGIIDTLITYLDTLSVHGSTLIGTLTQLLVAPDNTLVTDIQDSIYIDGIWGGYFVNLLNDLKTNTADEDEIIGNLQTYLNVTFLTETRNDNIQFLITQITTKYPDTIFNKWIRAKKNVPLMYSKQKTTTLECDGIKILDETTGSNMFLSACLPNMYHKRSPNFRNINMYSFALYPNDLRPSGHLNFSTLKDVKLKIELEYDGAHGVFDFDDNFITSFGIDPIYFPKQVIIIAKSYNMMIIRDGEARIIY